MKKYVFKILVCISLLTSISHVIADANNGYTTAANIYSGFSSRGWYGGGVAYQLAEWRKKEDISTKVENVVSVNFPTPSVPKPCLPTVICNELIYPSNHHQ